MIMADAVCYEMTLLEMEPETSDPKPSQPLAIS